jgi:hypothetical protein
MTLISPSLFETGFSVSYSDKNYSKTALYSISKGESGFVHLLMHVLIGRMINNMTAPNITKAGRILLKTY